MHTPCWKREEAMHAVMTCHQKDAVRLQCIFITGVWVGPPRVLRSRCRGGGWRIQICRVSLYYHFPVTSSAVSLPLQESHTLLSISPHHASSLPLPFIPFFFLYLVLCLCPLCYPLRLCPLCSAPFPQLSPLSPPIHSSHAFYFIFLD